MLCVHQIGIKIYRYSIFKVCFAKFDSKELRKINFSQLYVAKRKHRFIILISIIFTVNNVQIKSRVKYLLTFFFLLRSCAQLKFLSFLAACALPNQNFSNLKNANSGDRYGSLLAFFLILKFLRYRYYCRY